MTPAALYLGDCRALLRWLPDCSVDAVITDPGAVLSPRAGAVLDMQA